MSAIVHGLGGTVIEDDEFNTDEFEWDRITHVICAAQPGKGIKRNSKVLMCLTWGVHMAHTTHLLHPSYLKQSKKLGRFADEEEYKWANHPDLQICGPEGKPDPLSDRIRKLAGYGNPRYETPGFKRQWIGKDGKPSDFEWRAFGLLGFKNDPTLKRLLTNILKRLYSVYCITIFDFDGETNPMQALFMDMLFTSAGPPDIGSFHFLKVIADKQALLDHPGMRIYWHKILLDGGVDSTTPLTGFAALEKARIAQGYEVHIPNPGECDHFDEFDEWDYESCPYKNEFQKELDRVNGPNPKRKSDEVVSEACEATEGNEAKRPRTRSSFKAPGTPPAPLLVGIELNPGPGDENNHVASLAAEDPVGGNLGGAAIDFSRASTEILPKEAYLDSSTASVATPEAPSLTDAAMLVGSATSGSADASTNKRHLPSRGCKRSFTSTPQNIKLLRMQSHT
jgi:hypothetical protein